jgi:hypothetical protein
MEPPQSPWKRPKLVSISKTKSLKRKSVLFGETLNNSSNGSFVDNNNDNDDSPMRLAKTPKTHLNLFKVMSSQSLNNSSLNGSPLASTENTLHDFFSGSTTEASSQKANVKEKGSSGLFLASASSSAIASMYSSPATAAPLITRKTHSDSDFTLLLTHNNNNNSTKKEPEASDLFSHATLIPIDWSLKTRMRFLSKTPFACYSGIKSQQESEAVLNFAKFNSFYKNLSDANYLSYEQSKDSFKALFGETNNFWTFPYLPWLNLYPRNIGVSSCSSEPLNIEIQKTMAKCW